MRYLILVIIGCLVVATAVACGYMMGQADDGAEESVSPDVVTPEKPAETPADVEEEGETLVQGAILRADVEPLSKSEADALSVGYSWGAQLPLSVNKQ